MQYNNQAYLSLVWKDPKERKQYLIGRLSKGEEFVFKYDDEIKNALKAGFHPLLAFSNLKQEYHSKLMFPSFSSRLPDPKRKDINKILNKYNMDEYDAYTLLQRGGARLPIDSFEFIDPILENETGDIKRNFYVAGVRHYNKCDGKDCTLLDIPRAGDYLVLHIDENNPYDENIEEAEYQDITGEAYTAPAVQPSGSETGITERMQTMETRFDAQEGAINDLLISVIPELLGGE